MQNKGWWMWNKLLVSSNSSSSDLLLEKNFYLGLNLRMFKRYVFFKHTALRVKFLKTLKSRIGSQLEEFLFLLTLRWKWRCKIKIAVDKDEFEKNSKRNTSWESFDRNSKHQKLLLKFEWMRKKLRFNDKIWVKTKARGRSSTWNCALKSWKDFQSLSSTRVKTLPIQKPIDHTIYRYMSKLTPSKF